MRVAEMHLNRAENMLNKEDEISSRPARTWFQSEKDKARARDASKELVEAEARGELQKKKKRTPTEILKQVDKSLRKGQGAGGGKVDTGMHRLSRKKRRRLERLAGMDYDAAENAIEQEKSRSKNQDHDEDDVKSKKQLIKKELAKHEESMSVKRAEVVGKAAKRKAKSTNQPAKLGLGDEDKNADNKRAVAYWGKQQEQMMKELEGESVGRKVRRRVTTVVNEGAEDEGSSSHHGEGGDEKKKSSPYGFTEFDPMRIRLKKKKNADRPGSFHSKKKHKRR
jgi:hypothetical protein